MTHTHDRETIESRWSGADADRRGILNEARRCAALTKPWVLPPENQQADQELPENYQSLGARGCTNLEGRMLTALYPVDIPWFALDITARLRTAAEMDPRALQAIRQRLFAYEVLIQSLLESSHLRPRSNGIAANFRSKKREAISQTLITGDVLESLDSEWRLKVYRRDMYTTQRDSSGAVLNHIIRERIDPLSLTDEQLATCRLDRAKLAKEGAAQRMKSLYTLVEWQPVARTWLIEQEVEGGFVINESEETVSPYFATSFELVGGENYGRGFIAQLKGDLKSLDELGLRQLQFAEMASKLNPVIDYGSEVTPSDLEKPSGQAFRARVQDGKCTDVGMFKPEQLADFSVVERVVDRLMSRLGPAFLMESESAPTGDRVTKFAWQRVAIELEGALGGVYAPIADEQQIPLLQRAVHQAQAQKLMPHMPGDAVEIKALTGIAALSRESDAARLLDLVQVLSVLSDSAKQKIDEGVLIDVLARYRRIDEPGLIKTDAQLRREREEAMRMQSQMEAQSKTIEVAGDVARERLAPRGPATRAA